jgi:hypothetical protein
MKEKKAASRDKTIGLEINGAHGWLTDSIVSID